MALYRQDSTTQSNCFNIFRKLRNDKNIISSISVTDIVSDDYLGKWNYRAIQSENLKLFSSYS